MSYNTIPLKTPLFWDLHLHGVAGIDFMHASIDEIIFACTDLKKHGIGYFSPTLLSSPWGMLKSACSNWGLFFEKLNQKNYFSNKLALPIGLHLEGPFLNPNKSGAHSKKVLLAPTIERLDELIRASKNHIAILTIAPELQRATQMIRWARKQNIRVQLGHSEASHKIAKNAVHAGATGITHLFNAMHIHHREPGLLSSLLLKNVTAEIITDATHIHPEYLYWWLIAAAEKLYAVSDGCPLVGCKHKKNSTLGSLQIIKTRDGGVLKKSKTLAGGTSYLTQHPALLSRTLTLSTQDKEKLLKLYYFNQQKLFKSKKNSGWNYFNPKTLELIKSTS